MKKSKIIASVICVLIVSMVSVGIMLCSFENKITESSLIDEYSSVCESEDTAFAGDKLEYVGPQKDTTLTETEVHTTTTDQNETETILETVITDMVTELTSITTVTQITKMVEAAPEVKRTTSKNTHTQNTTTTTTSETTRLNTSATTKESVTSSITSSTKETQSTTTNSSLYSYENLPCTQAEFYMLANLVAHEYGADWVTLHEKAKVVMTVMNRVRDSRYPNSIRSVILQRNQYCWVPDSYYWRRTTQSCKDAVLYYFNHRSSYSTTLNSFWGDGRVNHFYAA